MKYKNRNIKVFEKNIANIDIDNILNFPKPMHHDIYIYDNFEKIESTTMNKPKNIFHYPLHQTLS
jgi:hypothetical protein